MRQVTGLHGTLVNVLDVIFDPTRTKLSVPVPPFIVNVGIVQWSEAFNEHKGSLLPEKRLKPSPWHICQVWTESA